MERTSYPQESLTPATRKGRMNLAEDNWRWYGYPNVESDYSPLDTSRWGITTYRLDIKHPADIHKYPYDLVIARIDANRLDLVQKACRHGFYICDVLTYWKGTTGRSDNKPLPTGYWERPIEAKDSGAIAEIARSCFTDYVGHYHADPRMDKEDATEAYVEWAANSTSGIVIEHEKYEYPMVHRPVVAFGTFGSPCELVLAGTGKAHAGNGLYGYMVRACMRWGYMKGVGEIEISTQVNNTHVQRTWVEHGLKPHKHVYTLHRWPD